MKKYPSRFRSVLWTLGFALTIIGGLAVAINLWGELSTRVMDNQSSSPNDHTCARPVDWVRINNRVSGVGEENRVVVKIADVFVENGCADHLSMEIIAPSSDVKPSLKQTVSITPNSYNSIEWTFVPKKPGNMIVTVRDEMGSITRGVFAYSFFGLNYISMRIVGILFFPIGLWLLEVDNRNRKK